MIKKRKLTSLVLATAMVITTIAGCCNSGGKTAHLRLIQMRAHRVKYLTFIAGIQSSRTDLNILRNQENYLQM